MKKNSNVKNFNITSKVAFFTLKKYPVYPVLCKYWHHCLPKLHDNTELEEKLKDTSQLDQIGKT